MLRKLLVGAAFAAMLNGCGVGRPIREAVVLDEAVHGLVTAVRLPKHLVEVQRDTGSNIGGRTRLYNYQADICGDRFSSTIISASLGVNHVYVGIGNIVMEDENGDGLDRVTLFDRSFSTHGAIPVRELAPTKASRRLYRAVLNLIAGHKRREDLGPLYREFRRARYNFLD